MNCLNSFRSLPWVTLGIVAVSLALQLGGSTVQGLLEWSAGEVGLLSVLRSFSGHLVHWSWDHFLWDGLALLVLGMLVEEKGRGRLVGCLAVSVLYSEVSLRCIGNFDSYRGLSGFAMALFALAGVRLVESGIGRRSVVLTVLGCGMVVMLLAKSGYELWSGAALFAKGGGFELAAEVHLAGVLAALTVFGCEQFVSRKLHGYSAEVGSPVS